MKRIIAIALAAVLLLALLPLGLLASAETVTAKPFYTLNCSELWNPEPFVFERIRFSSPKITEDYKYLVSAYGAKDIETIAQITKEEFDKRPEGTRYIMLDLMTKAVHGLVEKNVYFDKAEAVIKGWVEEFIKEYHRIGGKLDGITVDLEYKYGSAWYIHLGALNKNDDSRYNNPNLFKDIVEDPRYKTEIRPMLEEYGFPFETATSNMTEIHGIDVQRSEAYVIWNVMMHNRKSMMIDRSVYEPMVKYYPEANVADYQVGYTYGWQKTIKDDETPLSGNHLSCGTTSTFNAYSARPNVSMSGYTTENEPAGNPSYDTPAACNDALYELTAFNRVLWDVNLLKNMMAATPSGKIACHITYFNYDPDRVGTYSNTPYYTEDILHIGLMDPKPFMGYIRETEVFNNGEAFKDPNMSDYGYAIKVVNDIMAELTRVAGASDRKPILVPATWNSRFILSGMYAGGRNIWRITPDTSTGVSLEQFKVKDKAPTFYIDGQTITFPQGRIIEDGNVRQVGTCGYWVETPANVMPVITNDTNRYSEYPSLLESFERYKPGTALTSDTALPKAVWSVSGSATVQTVGNGKALAMTGVSSVKSVKLPENITAADSYAQQQAWEVTATLPQNGKMRVLSYAETDTGLKIEGGKAIYFEGSHQKEIPGVTLTPGGTYIFKREVDFRNATSFKNSYFVYDASGKLLGSVSDVPMGVAELPIKEIGFYTTAVSDAAYIDNFKMYPIGVTTELEAYDAATGFEVDVNAASNKDTAYRLSWMNASSEYKVAKVYNNGTLVEEIQMAPGQDGVNTGVVKGSGIKFSVTTENGTAPSVPNYDSGDYNWTAVAQTIGLATGKVDASADNNNDNINNGGTTDTTSPNGGADATAPNGGADATAPNGDSDATVPSGDNSGNSNSNTNKPGVNKPGANTPENNNNAALWIIIIVGAVLFLAAVGFAVCYFVLKPKWLMGLLSGKKKSSEKAETDEAPKDEIAE